MLSSTFQIPSSRHTPCVVNTLLGSSSDGRAGWSGAEGVLVLTQGRVATGGGARRAGDRVCPLGCMCEGQCVTADMRGEAHRGQGSAQDQRRDMASGQPRRKRLTSCCWHHHRSHLLRETGETLRPLPNASVHFRPCRTLCSIS